MPGGGKRLTNARTIAIAERNKRALELRKAGATWAQIAEQCGFNSFQAAHVCVRTELDKLPKEAAEELRIVQRERLERMYLSIFPQIQQGHLGAIDRGLRIMERQAKLDGLDSAGMLQALQEQTNKGISTDTLTAFRIALGIQDATS